MRLAFLSDIHFGEEQDLRAYSFALRLLKELNIDRIFLGGDIFDQVAVSGYSKSLSLEMSLQEELLGGFRQLKRLRSIFGSTKIQFLPGNHETRLVRFLESKARALAGLEVLSYRKLYNLDKLDIEYCEEGTPVQVGHLFLLHGHELIKGAKYPASKVLEKTGNNALFGHVHHASVAYQACLDGRTIVAWSNSCLCRLTPRYVLKPNWTQGFTIVDFSKSGYFAVTPIIFWVNKANELATIIEGKYYYARA